MTITSKDEYPIRLFAQACEQMNDFSRSLYSNPLFKTVRTGADIRNYDYGWRIEKWVEAEICRSEALWACWWLELGSESEKWKLESNLSISQGELHIGLPTRYASTEEELQNCLTSVVNGLVNALRDNIDFSNAVKK